MKEVNVRNICHVSSRKNGQAHIEVIISFVVFITAITFLLIYIQPQKSDVLETSLIENVYGSFINVTQTNLVVALINKSGNSCKPDIFEGNAIKIDLKTGYYYIYVSLYINNSLPICSSEDGFVLGNIQKKKVLSQVLLDELKAKYYENYESLKTELNIPPTVDFAVVSGDYELTKTIPDEMKVVAKIYRLQVVYYNGSLVTKDFTIKIW